MLACCPVGSIDFTITCLGTAWANHGKKEGTPWACKTPGLLSESAKKRWAKAKLEVRADFVLCDYEILVLILCFVILCSVITID
jgi:hypothetical protein